MQGHPPEWYTAEALQNALKGLVTPDAREAASDAFMEGWHKSLNLHWPLPPTLSTLPTITLTLPTLACELLPCLSPPPTLPLERKSETSNRDEPNASRRGTLGKRAVKPTARFQEATPEKAINKKGIVDEPKASNRGKSDKRASTAEETKQVKKGKRDWASWDEAHHKRKTTRLVALPLHLVDPQRNFQCLLQEFKVCS
jgi:hypothetical protein